MRTRTRGTIVAALVVGLGAAAPAAHAEDRAYLKLDGISGDVRQPGVDGTIQLTSFRVAVQASGDRVQLSNIVVEKRVDRTSPALLQRLVQHSTLGSASVSIYRPSTIGTSNSSNTLTLAQRYCLANVVISGISTAFQAGGETVESVELAAGGMGQFAPVGALYAETAMGPGNSACSGAPPAP